MEIWGGITSLCVLRWWRSWGCGWERCEQMRKIIMRNWVVTEFCVQVSLLRPIRQIWLLIRLVSMLIRGIVTPIRNIVRLISYITSYPPYHSHLHPPSFFLALNSTLITEHKFMSSLSIYLCHDHEFTRSTVYTECEHSLSTAFTKDWLPSFLSHDYELTPEWCFSFRHASPQIDRHWPTLYESSKGKSTLHIPYVASYQPEKKSISTHCTSQLTATRLTVMKYSAHFAQLWTASASLDLVLTTIPQSRVGFGSGSDPQLDCSNGFYHMKTWTVAIGPVLPPKSRNWNLPTLAPIEILSSDRIVK